MVLVLEREYFEKGVNGELFLNQQLVCRTIELPWRENQRQVSCIPEGQYTVRLRCTKRFGRHLTVDRVPGRISILVHTFNNALKESRGCIAPVCQTTGEGQGHSSRIALDRLLGLLQPAFDKNETILLIIKKAIHANNHQKSKEAVAKVL